MNPRPPFAQKCTQQYRLPTSQLKKNSVSLAFSGTRIPHYTSVENTRLSHKKECVPDGQEMGSQAIPPNVQHAVLPIQLMDGMIEGVEVEMRYKGVCVRLV